MKYKILLLFIVTFTICNAQTKDQIIEIIKNYDLEQLKKLEIKFSKVYNLEKNKAIQFAGQTH